MELNTDKNMVCVKYLSDLSYAAKRTFKRMQRVKFTCFTVSQNFLAFGASSGGIYIFQRECCKFLKFIPNKESSAILISFSKDEKHIGLATSKGIIVIVENFLIDSDSQSKVYHEHMDFEIMCLEWQQNDLYIGDSSGVVSVITLGIDILPKTLFQLPLTTILRLDSSIVQMDIYRHYLLVSTRTRTYICDTQKEFYKPIGKKARDGFFGACFYGPKLDRGYRRDISPVSDKSRGIYRTFNEHEFEEENDINNECVIFCARPGVRLWQANFDGSVEITYQFKNSMHQNSADLLIIGQNEDARLQLVSYGDTSLVAPENNFAFGRIFTVCDRFILSYTANGLYVFDPRSSELRSWIRFHCDIKQVEISDSIIFVWTTDLEICLISLVELEELVLRCLYKKQYLLCTDICLHFNDSILNLLKTSNKLYLLLALRDRIAEEKLLKQLDPIFEAIEETNQKINANELEIAMDDIGWETLNPNDFDSLKNVEDKGDDSENKMDENKNINLFTKQFRLHKTHESINIPDFEGLVKRLSLEDIFSIIKEFSEHISKEFSEDATQWCQNLILNQLNAKNTNLKSLTEEFLDYITQAFITNNQHLSQYSCQCRYPLPNCHNFEPKYYKIGLKLLEIEKQREIVLKRIPYYVKNQLEKEEKLNLTLTVQFSDKEIFILNSKKFNYDLWDQTIRLFIKLKQGKCLNCDGEIDLEGVLSWSQVANLILQNIGAQYTLKLLKRYSNSIPNASLDHTFYQTCIFMATFNCGNGCLNPKKPVDFVNNLDQLSLIKFQKSLSKNLENRYLEPGHPPHTMPSPSDTLQTCSYCDLPLKNSILGSDRRFILECSHQFHSLCFSRNDRKCHICK